ncbi:MAG: undecaprenyl-diphosphatase [Verrucomicrobia bacterium]|jgi:undecaprenyl-diphosphatase|nr:undecaprenyl-diphosphatase [Verrucomicrobiota bacterium]
MTLWEAVFFGLVQGLSEFIPVSSTAHIVILGRLLHLETPGLTFEIFLHLASLLAVIIYFQRDLVRLALGSLRFLFTQKTCQPEDKTAFYFSVYLLVATLITGILGTLLSDLMGDGIKAMPIVAAGLLLTAVLLVLVERAQRIGQRELSDLKWTDAVVIGLAQTVAVFPGVSRSGSTLIAGLYLKMARATAVRFSFLLAIPVLMGSSVLALKDIQTGDLAAIGSSALALSFAVSFIASMISIIWLIRLLEQQRLYRFSCYLVLLAGLALYLG